MDRPRPGAYDARAAGGLRPAEAAGDLGRAPEAVQLRVDRVAHARCARAESAVQIAGGRFDGGPDKDAEAPLDSHTGKLGHGYPPLQRELVFFRVGLPARLNH